MRGNVANNWKIVVGCVKYSVQNTFLGKQCSPVKWRKILCNFCLELFSISLRIVLCALCNIRNQSKYRYKARGARIVMPVRHCDENLFFQLTCKMRSTLFLSQIPLQAEGKHSKKRKISICEQFSRNLFQIRLWKIRNNDYL